MATNSKNQFATKEDLRKMSSEIRDDIKSDIKGYQKEMKNYVGLLHERFADEVKVVAEQYITIDQRLTRVESKTDMLVETVADIKVDMTVMKEDMTVMKEDMSGLKTDMREVRGKLLPGAIRKVDKLEHRVTVLESRA